jgi:hypothetical protein
MFSEALSQLEDADTLLEHRVLQERLAKIGDLAVVPLPSPAFLQSLLDAPAPVSAFKIQRIAKSTLGVHMNSSSAEAVGAAVDEALSLRGRNPRHLWVRINAVVICASLLTILFTWWGLPPRSILYGIAVVLVDQGLKWILSRRPARSFISLPGSEGESKGPITLINLFHRITWSGIAWRALLISNTFSYGHPFTPGPFRDSIRFALIAGAALSNILEAWMLKGVTDWLSINLFRKRIIVLNAADLVLLSAMLQFLIVNGVHG